MLSVFNGLGNNYLTRTIRHALPKDKIRILIERKNKFQVLLGTFHFLLGVFSIPRRALTKSVMNYFRGHGSPGRTGGGNEDERNVVVE